MIRIAHRSTTLAAMFSLLLVPQAAWAGEVLDSSQAEQAEGDSTLWYDVELLGVEGKAFDDTISYYDRLPERAHGVVRDIVWNLSRHSAGECVRFETDATTIQARWTLTSERLAMPHMAAVGVSGLDLYVRTDDGRWRWLGAGRPEKFPTNTARLVTGIPGGNREYLLYLPLYNGVTKVELGIPEGNTLSTPQSREEAHRKPIVFYGTSITHGACASRPGMVHTAILGRRFDRPVINLGFSGNGRMEVEVAKLLAEIDAAVFVLDCLPNMDAVEVTARTAAVVQTLREAHPDTPIVLVEDRSYASSFLVTSQRNRNLSSRAALQAEYEKLIAAGDKHLYYITGEGMLGYDGEGTADSSHPNDLGFMRQADAFAEVIGPLLGSAK